MKPLNVTGNISRKMQHFSAIKHSRKTAFTLPGEIMTEFSFMLTAIMIAVMKLVPFGMDLTDICQSSA